MDKEEIDQLLEIAGKSRLHTVIIGVILLVLGLVFASNGIQAVVVEIIVTGIMMIYSGVHTVMLQGPNSKGGVSMIVLGVVFIAIVPIFEEIHGILLIFEFISIGVIHLLVAIGHREGKYGRKTSLVIGIVAIYVALSLITAHEESMDSLIIIMGYVLMALSVYVLYCAARNRPIGI